MACAINSYCFSYELIPMHHSCVRASHSCLKYAISLFFRKSPPFCWVAVSQPCCVSVPGVPGFQSKYAKARQYKQIWILAKTSQSPPKHGPNICLKSACIGILAETSQSPQKQGPKIYLLDCIPELNPKSLAIHNADLIAALRRMDGWMDVLCLTCCGGGVDGGGGIGRRPSSVDGGGGG